MRQRAPRRTRAHSHTHSHRGSDIDRYSHSYADLVCSSGYSGCHHHPAASSHRNLVRPHPDATTAGGSVAGTHRPAHQEPRWSCLLCQHCREGTGASSGPGGPDPIQRLDHDGQDRHEARVRPRRTRVRGLEFRYLFCHAGGTGHRCYRQRGPRRLCADRVLSNRTRRVCHDDADPLGRLRGRQPKRRPAHRRLQLGYRRGRGRQTLAGS